MRWLNLLRSVLAREWSMNLTGAASNLETRSQCCCCCYCYYYCLHLKLAADSNRYLSADGSNWSYAFIPWHYYCWYSSLDTRRRKRIVFIDSWQNHYWDHLMRQYCLQEEHRYCYCPLYGEGKAWFTNSDCLSHYGAIIMTGSCYLDVIEQQKCCSIVNETRSWYQWY